jgi:hypothetical protein
LVLAVGVEVELADEFAGGCVDDADVEVVDKHHDRGASEGSADADVVESAVVAEGDFAGLVDAVVADAVLAVGLMIRCGFGSCGVGDRWWGATHRRVGRRRPGNARPRAGVPDADERAPAAGLSDTRQVARGCARGDIAGRLER